MILSDRDIKERMSRGLEASRLVVEPTLPELLQPASLDVRLGRGFRLGGRHFGYDDQSDTFILRPGRFVLGTTLEHVEIPPNLVAQLGGKSSLARRGLVIHVTAGFIDPGFRGQITLELMNVHNTIPIKLEVGQRIGQLYFTEMTSWAERPYGSEGLNSHYQDQVGTTASRSE